MLSEATLTLTFLSYFAVIYNSHLYDLTSQVDLNANLDILLL